MTDAPRKRAPGGGAKPLYGERMTNCTVRLPPVQVARLKALGNGNLSKGLHKALGIDRDK